MASDILICGIGGQGTVLAAKLLAGAAMLSGYAVHSAETIGMAQRGGSVTSHVRIGEEKFSPLIPQHRADMIIAFELCEAVRNLDYLKKGGTVVANKKIVPSSQSVLAGKTFSEKTMTNFIEQSGAKLVLVDAEKICAELDSQKIVNTVLLGAAIQNGIEGISLSDAENAVRNSVKAEFVEMNLRALRAAGN